MLAEQHHNATFGLYLSIVLSLAAGFLISTSVPLGILLILAGAGCGVWGARNYATAKGYSQWVGIIGFNVIGWLIIARLPDRTTDKFGISALMAAALKDDDFRQILITILNTSSPKREELLDRLSLRCGDSQVMNRFRPAVESLKNESIRLAAIRELHA